MADLTPEEILAQLGLNKTEVAHHRAAIKVLRVRRQDLFFEGRTMDPPMNARIMGEAAGVTDAAVHQDLSARAARRADESNRTCPICSLLLPSPAERRAHEVDAHQTNGVTPG